MTEQTSSGGARTTGEPAAGRPTRSRPSTWRSRGRMSYGMGVAIAIVHPVSSLMFRLHYRHGDRLPTTGPVLLVANHVAILDPLAELRDAPAPPAFHPRPRRELPGDLTGSAA